jgi:hypothetical protein
MFLYSGMWLVFVTETVCSLRSTKRILNPLKPELNPSAKRCLPRFLLGILIFKGLTARCLYKSFGVKGLNVIHIILRL